MAAEKPVLQSFIGLFDLFGKRIAKFSGGEIDPASFAGFGVGQFQHAGIRKVALGGIGDGATDEIVLAGDPGEGRIVAVILKVGNQKDDRTAVLNGFKAVKRFCNIGFSGGIFCRGKDFAHDSGNGVASSLRGNLLYDPVGEEDQADIILIVDGCECQKGGDFRCQIGLCAGAGPEIQRAGDIDEELNRQLTLLGIAFDLGNARTGGDIPIDGTHVIAELVFADFIEFDALAFERSMVIPRETLVDESSCQDADRPHFLHEFQRIHFGRKCNRGEKKRQVEQARRTLSPRCGYKPIQVEWRGYFEYGNTTRHDSVAAGRL